MKQNKENNLDLEYQALLNEILNEGRIKGDRTGTGTTSIFGPVIRHDMASGFPLLTTKKMAFKGIRTELLWFMRGGTNIGPLLKDKNYIWVGDAMKNWLKNDDNYYTFVLDLESGGISDVAKSSIPIKDIDSSGLAVSFSKIMIHTRSIDYAALDKDMKEILFYGFIKLCETYGDFVAKWGELGPIYGKKWRDFRGVDQLNDVINSLRNNPDSRRIMVTAWDPADQKDAVLPPCHYGYQLWTADATHEERIEFFTKAYPELTKKYGRIGITPDVLDGKKIPEKIISLAWNQRSVDTALGLPFNIASYGLLLEILARMTNMIPHDLIGFLGDTHLYNDHINGACIQLERPILHQLPTLEITEKIDWSKSLDDVLEQLNWDTFSVQKTYQSYDRIYFPLSN